MSFFLTPQESLEDGLKRIALERLDQSIDKLTTLPDGRQKAVHDTRKNFKRVRAVLRLMRDALGEDAFKAHNGFFRDASRLLASIRDSAVMVETLDMMAQDEAEFADIRQALVERHEAISDELLNQQGVIKEVVTRIENGRSAIQTLSVGQNQFKTIAPSLRRVYSRGRKRMAYAYQHADDPETFHDWRKRVKYLWYHLEMMRPVWPSLCHVLIKDLHQISDFLGDAHDMAELSYVLRDESERFAHLPDVDRLLARLEEKHHALNQAAISLGERLYAERPSLFVERFSAYWSAWQDDVAAERPFVHQPIDLAREEKKGEPLLSTQESAEQLQLSVVEVRRLIQNGRLAAQKIGNQWIIRQADLNMLKESSQK